MSDEPNGDIEPVDPWATLRWAGVGRAAFLIALDNGGINRDRSEKRWRRDFRKWADKQPEEMMAPVDAWLRVRPRYGEQQ